MAKQAFLEGNRLLAARDYAAAAACYRAAVTSELGALPAWVNLGLALTELGDTAEAERCYRVALQLDPRRVETLTNLSDLLLRQKRFADAESACRQAIAAAPDAAAGAANYGVLLACMGWDAEAERSLRRAIELDPAYGKARFHLSCLLLQQGRWEEGWRQFEYRNPQAGATTALPMPDLPRWQGEPLTGKSLLVLPEQGYGDEIQFCRYLPLLKQRGLQRLTVICKPRLKTLFAALPGVDAVVAAGEPLPAASFDCLTYPMSCPLHFGTTPATIPATLPYLTVAPEAVAHWRAQLADAFAVGLVWQGNRRHENDADRSLPAAALAHLLAVPEIQFVSAQKAWCGPAAGEPAALQAVLPLAADLEDFADTAALIMALDLVISVDTAVAHLAGALGKPCWLLLPAYKTDWRWLTARSDSPWYPGVMRLFRQQRGEEWSAVTARVAAALAVARAQWHNNHASN